MKQPVNTLRLLAEIIGIIALAQVVITLFLPAIAPEAPLAIRVAIVASALSVLSAPAILWRIRDAMRRANRTVDIENSPSRWRSSIAAVVLLTVGTLFTSLAVLNALRHVNQHAAARFDQMNERLVAEVQKRMNQSLFGLLGARGVYVANESTCLREFAAYASSRDLTSDSPGAVSIGFMVRVEAQDLAAFNAREQARLAHESYAHGLATAGSGRVEASHLYVVKHVYPANVNAAKWAYEVGSEPIRWEAAERAVLTGKPTISGKFSLYQAGVSESRYPAFLYLVPVYKDGTSPETPHERVAALIGLVYAPIILNASLDGLEECVNHGLTLSIFDGPEPTSSSQLFGPKWNSKTPSAEKSTASVFESQKSITIGGTSWTLYTRSTPALLAGIDQSSPFLCGFTGALLTMFVAGITWTLGLSRHRAIRMARGMTADLAAAKTAAEAASSAKSAFLANMSHEIRTPLTAIMGFSDMLVEDGQNALSYPQRIKTAHTIRNASMHLLTVINDILDLSKIEAEKMKVDQVDTPLVAILHEVDSLIRPQATGKGLSLKVVLATPVPVSIKSDPTRLRQILLNLAGNAVKFTEFGGVTIAARIENQGENRRLLIDVSDTGEGISPEDSKSLFQPFGQGDQSLTRKHGGTGLGLSICRRFAELMGGTVSLAHTTPGKGSCFRIDLPLVTVEGVAMTANFVAVENNYPFSTNITAVCLNGRILLAEDGPDNQHLIAFHLRKAGASVDIARNGRIALEMIENAAAKQEPYNLLVTDMQMPEIDGYTLARTIRQKGITLPIVALTAHAMSHDRDKCISAGCDDYASKPIDKNALLNTCAAWINSSQRNSSMPRAVA